MSNFDPALLAGRMISKVEMVDNTLAFAFTCGSLMSVSDMAQYCCESRYMRTDDPLDYYAGAVFHGLEVRDGDSIDSDSYGVVDVQFLEVTTSKGSFTVATYNSHNGYYGGFEITTVGKVEPKPQPVVLSRRRKIEL